MSLRIILILFLMCRPDTATDGAGSLRTFRIVGRERVGSSSLLQGHPSSLHSDTLMSLRITPAFLSVETTANKYLNVELVTITGARLIHCRGMVKVLRVYGIY